MEAQFSQRRARQVRPWKPLGLTRCTASPSAHLAIRATNSGWRLFAQPAHLLQARVSDWRTCLAASLAFSRSALRLWYRRTRGTATNTTLHTRAMTSLWRQADLPELVATLATRPGHETVRTLVTEHPAQRPGQLTGARPRGPTTGGARRATMCFSALRCSSSSPISAARLAMCWRDCRLSRRARASTAADTSGSRPTAQASSRSSCETACRWRSAGWTCRPTSQSHPRVVGAGRSPTATTCSQILSSSAASSAEES